VHKSSTQGNETIFLIIDHDDIPYFNHYLLFAQRNQVTIVMSNSYIIAIDAISILDYG